MDDVGSPQPLRRLLPGQFGLLLRRHLGVGSGVCAWQVSSSDHHGQASTKRYQWSHLRCWTSVQFSRRSNSWAVLLRHGDSIFGNRGALHTDAVGGCRWVVRVGGIAH